MYVLAGPFFYSIRTPTAGVESTYIMGEEDIYTQVHTKEHTFGHDTHYGTYARWEIRTAGNTHGGIYRNRGYIRERTNTRESVGLFRHGTIGGDEGR